MSASRFFSDADTGIRVSKKQLDEFITRLAEDDSLRGEFGGDSVTPARVVEIAARHGFAFTQNELSSQAKPLADDEWAEAVRRFDGNHSDSYIIFLEEAPMSKEALSSFFKKVADDEALQKKLVEFAAAQGFEFSADELSDTDLDSVAGGLLISPTISSIAGKIEDVKVTDMTSIKYDNLPSIEDASPDGLNVFPKIEDLGR